MNTTIRRLGLVLAAVGVLLLATATYGFGSIVADRALNVETSGDDSAYLQYDSDDRVTVAEGTPAVAFGLTNGFSDAVDVSVTASGPTADSLTVSGPQHLTPGETGDYALSCGPTDTTSRDVPVTIDVEASGSSTNVSMERTLASVTIDCDG